MERYAIWNDAADLRCRKWSLTACYFYFLLVICYSLKILKGSNLNPLCIGHTDVVLALIAAGADLDLKDKRDDGGITALIEASKWSHMDTIRALLAAGANVNAKDVGGETALYIAARDGHVEVVAELLAAGATVNAKYLEGNIKLYSFWSED